MSDSQKDRQVLRANLEDGLVRDPRILLDPRLLGILHRELDQRLDRDHASEILLEAGVFHGLRDALRVIGRAESGASSIAPSFPMLAVQLTQQDESVFHGVLPERVEAEARLASLGPRSGPSCWLSCGYVAGWLSGLLERDFYVTEQSCVGAGDETCTLHARLAADDPRGASIPFAVLREKARQELEGLGAHPATEVHLDRFDDGSRAVHVWGPVMVVPYSGEETAHAIEGVAMEAGAEIVSVVIVDLGGAIVDDGFAAVALERVIEVIQSWGAEAVIAGASPLSARLVGSLGRGALVVREDLQDAIATAFQIADFQRFGM